MRNFNVNNINIIVAGAGHDDVAVVDFAMHKNRYNLS